MKPLTVQPIGPSASPAPEQLRSASVGRDRAGPARQELRRLFSFLRRRIYYSPRQNRRVVEEFHRLYYESRVWTQTNWFGVQVLKCPMDLWIYQELLHRLRPDVVVETGTSSGGSALYMAHLMDALGHGKVVTVDIVAKSDRPQHDRIEYVTGSSTDPGVFAQVRRAIGERSNILVVLDSDHRDEHVRKEMDLYSGLVPVGGYMVVEDTNLNGHPVFPAYGPGPMEALNRFLRQRSDFEIDEGMEKFFLTMNPRGYLRRVR